MQQGMNGPFVARAVSVFLEYFTLFYPLARPRPFKHNSFVLMTRSERDRAKNRTKIERPSKMRKTRPTDRSENATVHEDNGGQSRGGRV